MSYVANDFFSALSKIASLGCVTSAFMYFVHFMYVAVDYDTLLNDKRTHSAIQQYHRTRTMLFLRILVTVLSFCAINGKASKSGL